MDLFPVAVLGSRNYFVWQNCGGVRVQVLEFLQHSVCTGTLYCVLIARTQGADLIQRGGIALRTATAAAAKAAAGALWQPGGRAGPGTLWFDVPHHTPAGHRSAIARVRWAVRANVRNVPTRMRLCCLYICCSLLTVCVLLSASRDEEVVGVGRSQVLQPGGEFNCPQVGDQRED